MRQLILALILSFVAIPSFASTWCMKDDADPIQPVLNSCVTATILPSGTEVITTKTGARISGDDANKNAAGYFKMVAGENTPLQEFQTYSGWLYSFADNVFTKTRQVISNYDNLTLSEFKWQKYWSYMNEHVLPVRIQDCVYSGKVIPETARALMVEAISSGKTMTYEVYSEATGMPDYFERTAVQAAGVLDYCLDAVNAVNTNIATKADAIMACADADCVNLITW